jgi:AcrR family transcriptional regulator
MEWGRRVSRDTEARRKYDSSRRQADAEVRHRRIVDEATKLFLDHGFGATSIGQIAEAADVSPQTIYASFGSKAGVLSNVIDVALVGDYEDVPAFDRAPPLKEAGDFTAYARFVRAINERVGPLIRVMEQAAATDPGLTELRSTLVDRIRDDCRRWIAQIGGKALRPGLSKEEAVDVMAVTESPYVYSFFTEDAGWSPDQYERWLTHALPHLLLKPELLA